MDSNQQQYDASQLVDDEQGLNLRHYVDIALKHRLVVALTVVCIFAVTAVLSYKAPRIYRATSSVIIEVSSPQILNDVDEVVELGAQGYWGYKEYYGTQYKVIASRPVAERVVRELVLDRDLDFLGLANLPPEKQEELPELLAKADPAAILMAKTSVQAVRNSRIVQIAVRDRDPQRATMLANAIAEAYVEINLDYKLEATRGAISWLTEQVNDLKGKVDNAEQALFDFKRENNVLGTKLEDRQNIITKNLEQLNQQLSAARAERIRLEAGWRQVQEARESGEGDLLAASLAALGTPDTLRTLRAQMMAQRQHITDLSQTYGAKHPLMKAALEKQESLAKAIERELNKTVKGVESRFITARDTERGLARAIEAEKTRGLDLNAKELQHSRLNRDADYNRNLYGLLSGRLKEMNLSRMSNANNVRVFERAEKPIAPVSPRVRLNLIIGLLGGLLLGFGLAFLLELLDNTVKSQEDVEAMLGIPALGFVPRISEEVLRKSAKEAGRPLSAFARDLHVRDRPKSTVAECCRSIRTNLTFMSPDKPITCFMVTSPSPQEGKTTTVINIGTTFAQANLKTLVIDTDLRRPRIHKTFGVPNDEGVSSVVAGQEDVFDCIKKTDIENLDLLCCGPIPPNPAELLGTQRFEEMVLRLREHYDRVILDSPPITAVADAPILSRVTDGVVLVVKAGQSTREVVRQGFRSMSDVNANMLGVVVNDLDLEGRGYRYRYRYRYGGYRTYGYYYTSESEEAGTTA